MFVIRQTTLDDAPLLREVLNEVACERRYLAMLEGPPLDRFLKFVSGSVEKNYPFFVAGEGAKIVGWCDITPGAHGEAHVGNLGMGVRKDYRGRGIGRQLIEAALAKARTQPFEKIELSVYSSNAAAIALYEKLGFVEEGCRKRGRLVDGIYDDIILMALFLRS